MVVEIVLKKVVPIVIEVLVLFIIIEVAVVLVIVEVAERLKHNQVGIFCVTYMKKLK